MGFLPPNFRLGDLNLLKDAERIVQPSWSPEDVLKRVQEMAIFEGPPPDLASYGYTPGMYGPQNKVSRAIVDTMKQVPVLDLLMGAGKFLAHKQFGNPRAEAEKSRTAAMLQHKQAQQNFAGKVLDYLADTAKAEAIGRQGLSDLDLKLALEQMKQEGALQRVLAQQQGATARNAADIASAQRIFGDRTLSWAISNWDQMTPQQRINTLRQLESRGLPFSYDPNDIDTRSFWDKLLETGESLAGKVFGKKKETPPVKAEKTPTKRRPRKTLEEIFSIPSREQAK